MTFDLEALVEAVDERAAIKAARKTVGQLPSQVAISIPKVARILDTSDSTVDRMIEAGLLWTVPTGTNRRLVAIASVEALVEAGRIEAQARAAKACQTVAALEAVTDPARREAS